MGTYQNIPSNVKDKMLHLNIITTKKKRQNAGWASLDMGGNIVLIWVCYSGPFTE